MGTSSPARHAFNSHIFHQFAEAAEVEKVDPVAEAMARRRAALLAPTEGSSEEGEDAASSKTGVVLFFVIHPWFKSMKAFSSNCNAGARIHRSRGCRVELGMQWQECCIWNYYEKNGFVSSLNTGAGAAELKKGCNDRSAAFANIIKKALVSPILGRDKVFKHSHRCCRRLHWPVLCCLLLINHCMLATLLQFIKHQKTKT